MVVPLTMPVTRRMRSPASDSRSGRMSGMPPATDASNSRSTPAVAATSNSSSPKFASSSLFAVTTGLPDFSAVRISERAGSIPPITSTITSTSGSATTRSASLVSTPGANATVALLREVLHRDARDLEPHARAARDQVGVGVEQAERARCRRCRTRGSRPVPARRRCAPCSPFSRIGPSSDSGRVPAGSATSRRTRSSGSLGGPRPGRSRRARTPPPGGRPCCSSRPSSARTRR